VRWQIWQRVTGSWVTVTGNRREGDLLICLYDARPAGVIMPGCSRCTHATRLLRVSRFENQLIVRLICGKVNHNADGFDLALHSVGRFESPLVFLYAGFRAAEPKIKAGGERSAEA
jgi:hypothetical protein